jgi:nitrite reductase/ring-hydroxylating ferredoxin subunit
MACHDTDDAGPDLSRGVTLAAFGAQTMLRGHVGGDAVLLVRVGEDVLAVGATCTHYGGPLAQGLVVGDTVRCPWHHACFSLRSGEALGAPAFDALPCGGSSAMASASSCTNVWPARRCRLPPASTHPRTSSSSAAAPPASPAPRCCAGAATLAG